MQITTAGYEVLDQPNRRATVDSSWVAKHSSVEPKPIDVAKRWRVLTGSPNMLRDNFAPSRSPALVAQERGPKIRLDSRAAWSGGQRLHPRFEFADFPSTLVFMARAGFAAERLDHHPIRANVYCRVDVEIWSHNSSGGSRLCAELAKAIEAAAVS